MNQPPPPEPGPPTPEPASLDAYVRANAGQYTDEALTDALVRAGHSPESVRAALAALPSRAGHGVAQQAVTRLVALYVGVFALLSVGMLLNSRTDFGAYMPTPAGGIGILAVSLGVAFVISLVWIASRALFVILALGLAALSFMAQSPLPALGLGALAVGLAVYRLRRPAGRPIQHADMAQLIIVPLLLLLGIAGTCVVSGLPIPVTA